MDKYLLRWMVVVASVIVGLNSATAQTLTQQLQQEDPAVLAQQARETGDVVRGAILFHQGNINCASCHQRQDTTAAIGPDLRERPEGTTDAYLVQSVLSPSQDIRKGYETTVIATVEGRIVTGVIVGENDERIQLRQSDDPGKVITFAISDIDQRKVSPTSTMPDNLVEQMTGRQQFLDLMRYVLELNDQPIQPVANSKSDYERQLSNRLHGLKLTQELHCAACHDLGPLADGVVGHQAPLLKWSGKHLNPDYLQQFLTDPNQIKPGTLMPSVLASLPEPDRRQVATALTHFIVSKAGNQFHSQPIDPSAVAVGKTTFHQVGCVACHGPRDEQAREKPSDDSVPLGDLSGKYSLDGLVQFLENPLQARPSGHMPGMNLTHRQAVNVASFLLQGSPEVSDSWQADPKLVQQGQEAFRNWNCAQCHSDFGVDPLDKPVSIALSRADLSWRDSESGCLSGETGPWPKYDLTGGEIDQMVEAIQAWSRPLEDQEKIDHALSSFRCISCHQRDGLGGVTSERNPHFQTTNLNLGDQGRIPPQLSGVGAKLQPDWLRDVLVNGRAIRPYMLTQMPQFGEKNIGHLVPLLDKVDQLPTARMATLEDAKEARQTGLHLVGRDGLNCIACHTYKFKTSDTMPAVDLTEMGQRLKKNWFYHYMLAPQSFSPNTVMPSFWPNGKAIRSDLEGSPEEQLEAIWQYLLDGRQANAPRGIVNERLEILVDDEAQMLRRKYPGIGKRGIGVGYPGGVNLAFDAEQMRLASIWKGGFVDPGGVWTGQGSGNVRPLGKTLDFAPGPDIDWSQNRWVVDQGRPPDHQFQGYELDANRRPTFLYKVAGVAIRDYFHEMTDSESGGSFLRRTIECESSDSRLSLRIAADGQITKIDQHRYRVGERLIIHVISEQGVHQVESESGDPYLEITLPDSDGSSVPIVVDYRWDEADTKR